MVMWYGSGTVSSCPLPVNQSNLLMHLSVDVSSASVSGVHETV